MKIILKRSILISLFIVICFFASNIYGATANISANKTSAYVGDSVSINVNINAAAWNLNVSGNGISGGNITGFNMEGNNQTTNKTYALNTQSAGTYTIYLKGDISDGATDVTTDISKSVVVTIKTRPVATNPSTGNTTTKPSTNTSTTKPSVSTTNKNTSTNKNTTSLSSNAYLKEFRINEPGITPTFKKDIFNYAVTIGEDINRINVTAVPEHSKATVSVTGNTDLKEGENTILVKVTAQDKKTTNIYKIMVNKTNDPIKSNAYLQNLIITNLTLNPEFSSEIFEYDLGTINSEIQKLDISAFPVNEKAKVDILGNDYLAVGENNIKIIVTSENSKIQKTYNLKVIKQEASKLADMDANMESNKWENKSSIGNTFSVMGEILKEKASIILLYIFVWIEFLQVVYLYEKLKKYEEKEEIKEYNKVKNKENK